MKLIDKLAEESAQNTILPHVDIIQLYKDAYKAGFEDGIESAIDVLYDSGRDPTGYGESCIRELLDEEAEE